MARNDNDGATRLGARNGRDHATDGGNHYDRNISTPGRPAHEGEARDKFGGVNIGASFFGWIVAIGIAILLTSIVGAIGTAVGFSGNLSQTDAERQAGTIGIVSAIVLLLVLMVAYYAGGYVAGRMSRFDGGRQGFMVWVIGLLVTIAAAVLGTVFGSQYNILDRVSLPRLPVSLDQIGWGALITAVAVIVLTLLAAVMGGRVGHRYHNRVDRAARR
jgi:hypothetical protein